MLELYRKKRGGNHKYDTAGENPPCGLDCVISHTKKLYSKMGIDETWNSVKIRGCSAKKLPLIWCRRCVIHRLRTSYDRGQQFCPVGIYMIMEVKSGQVSKDGCGSLKSRTGWASLSFMKRI